MCSKCVIIFGTNSVHLLLFSGGNRRYGGRGSDRQDRGEYNNYSRGGGRREESFPNYNGMCTATDI